MAKMIARVWTLDFEGSPLRPCGEPRSSLNVGKNVAERNF